MVYVGLHLLLLLVSHPCQRVKPISVQPSRRYIKVTRTFFSDDVTVGVTTIDEGATEALTCTASYGGYLPVDVESWFTKLRMLMDGIVVEENYLVDRETSTISVVSPHPSIF